MVDCEIAILERRVRWLDSYRRSIAVGVATAFAGLIIYELTDFLGSYWPEVNVVLFALLSALLVGWIVEVGLAGITAWWETKHDRLLCARDLPRAEILLRRK